MTDLSLQKLRQELDILIPYAVPAADRQSAFALLSKYQEDLIALHLFHEFFSFLPEAEDDAIRIIRLLDHREGTFLLCATTILDHYLYMVTPEGAEFLGTQREGIWDEEVLKFLGLDHESALKKYFDLAKFPVYVPVHLDRSRCAVCATADGGLHRLGCPVEVCPWCGGQLTKCDCRFQYLKQDKVENEGQLAGFIAALATKGRVPFDATNHQPSYPTAGGPEAEEEPDYID